MAHEAHPEVGAAGVAHGTQGGGQAGNLVLQVLDPERVLFVPLAQNPKNMRTTVVYCSRFCSQKKTENWQMKRKTIQGRALLEARGGLVEASNQARRAGLDALDAAPEPEGRRELLVLDGP